MGHYLMIPKRIEQLEIVPYYIRQKKNKSEFGSGKLSMESSSSTICNDNNSNNNNSCLASNHHDHNIQQVATYLPYHETIKKWRSHGNENEDVNDDKDDDVALYSSANCQYYAMFASRDIHPDKGVCVTYIVLCVIVLCMYYYLVIHTYRVESNQYKIILCTYVSHHDKSVTCILHFSSSSSFIYIFFLSLLLLLLLLLSILHLHLYIYIYIYIYICIMHML